jgi:hypothetical protein
MFIRVSPNTLRGLLIKSSYLEIITTEVRYVRFFKYLIRYIIPTILLEVSVSLPDSFRKIQINGSRI